MNSPVLHYAAKEFTGLTGSATVNWDPFDFTSAPFPASGFSVLRCIIDVDCVGISSIDLGNTYTQFYKAHVGYTWKLSGFVGTITITDVRLNTSSQFTWNVANTGGAGGLRISATGVATLQTFNVAMVARIVVYGDV